MKRIALSLLAVTLAFAFACKQEGNINGNRSGNSNATANSNRGDDNSNVEGIAPMSEKNVTISITDDATKPGRCAITVSPDSITLSKSRKDRIKWCITNTSTSASGATVTIANFVDRSSPGKMNPFGDGSNDDNSFDITPGDYDCNMKTKDAFSREEGTYKYTITVKVGGSEKGILDPQVIIDN